MNTRKRSRQKTAMELEQDRTKSIAKLSPEIKAKIGQQLRVMYEEVVCQGVPDRFVEILQRLDSDDDGDNDHDEAPASDRRGRAQDQ
jgi:Anti-sigma factor NepR